MREFGTDKEGRRGSKIPKIQLTSFMYGPLVAGLPPRPDGALRLRGADAAAARAPSPPLPRRAGPPLRAADHQGGEIKGGWTDE